MPDWKTKKVDDSKINIENDQTIQKQNLKLGFIININLICKVNVIR